jgi:hypothetical protein
VSSFGMSFSPLHELSKIKSAHLYADTCQAVFLWSPAWSKKKRLLAKGFWENTEIAYCQKNQEGVQ